MCVVCRLVSSFVCLPYVLRSSVLRCCCCSCWTRYAFLPFKLSHFFLLYDVRMDECLSVCTIIACRVMPTYIHINVCVRVYVCWLGWLFIWQRSGRFDVNNASSNRNVDVVKFDNIAFRFNLFKFHLIKIKIPSVQKFFSLVLLQCCQAFSKETTPNRAKWKNRENIDRR